MPYYVVRSEEHISSLGFLLFLISSFSRLSTLLGLLQDLGTYDVFALRWNLQIHVFQAVMLTLPMHSVGVAARWV
jgi:hypothetical protein